MELELDKLMDLTACPHTIYLCQEPTSNCKNPKKCKIGAHIGCSCTLVEKVPVLDLLWLHSQRAKVGEKSAMQMGLCDQKETELKKKNKKEEIDQEPL